MKKISIVLAIALMATIYSCGNGGQGSNEQKADSLTSQTSKQVINDPKQGNEITEESNEIAEENNETTKESNKLTEENTNIDIKSIVQDALEVDSESATASYSFDSISSGNEVTMVFGLGIYDAGDEVYIAICDRSGNIKAKYKHKGKNDALILEEVKLMDKPYNVKENAKLVGVIYKKLSRGRSSMLSKDLFLFVVEGDKMRPILEDCTIALSSSITKEHTKIIPDPTSKSDDGFYDLKLITTEFELNEETGEKIESTKKETVKVIKYIDGKYTTP